MSQVPEWFVYVSPVIAALAMVISAGSQRIAAASLRLARETYARAGAQVLLWFEPEIPAISDILYVVIRNRGLASAQIESLVLERPTLTKGGGRLDFLVEGAVEIINGPTLPVVIEGNSVIRMKCRVKQVEIFHRGTRRFADKYERQVFTKYGTLIAVLGNGDTVSYRRWWGKFYFSEQSWRERVLLDYFRSPPTRTGDSE